MTGSDLSLIRALLAIGWSILQRKKKKEQLLPSCVILGRPPNLAVPGYSHL